MKKQIEDFGVPKEDVEATHGLLGQVLVGFTEFANFSLNITFIFWIKKEAHIFYTP